MNEITGWSRLKGTDYNDDGELWTGPTVTGMSDLY